MSLKVGISLTLAISGINAAAQLKDWPEPQLAYAHDQEQMTAELISAEKQELDAYDHWMKIKYKTDETQDGLMRMQRRTRRYGALLKGQFVSLDDMALAQYYETKAENHNRRHPLDLQQARALFEFQKLRVLTKGNSKIDQRLAMAEALLDSRRAERAALEFDLKTAEFGKKLAELKVAASRTLLDRRQISVVDMENRQDLLEDFSRDVTNLKDHMKNLDDVVTGLERDVKRLSSMVQK